MSQFPGREVERSVSLPRAIYDRLLKEAQRALPNECCGLLGGKEGVVKEIFPSSNSLASPTAYEIPPEELFAHFRAMREQKFSLVAIYHSHPQGENTPSRRDRERAYYPDAAYIIVSPEENNPAPVRAFHLDGEGWKELAVSVKD